jgi:hypothetical protein
MAFHFRWRIVTKSPTVNSPKKLFFGLFIIGGWLFWPDKQLGFTLKNWVISQFKSAMPTTIEAAS